MCLGQVQAPARKLLAIAWKRRKPADIQVDTLHKKHHLLRLIYMHVNKGDNSVRKTSSQILPTAPRSLQLLRLRTKLSKFNKKIS
jgi:hypothetical protein